MNRLPYPESSSLGKSRCHRKRDPCAPYSFTFTHTYTMHIKQQQYSLLFYSNNNRLFVQDDGILLDVLVKNCKRKWRPEEIYDGIRYIFFIFRSFDFFLNARKLKVDGHAYYEGPKIWQMGRRVP